MPRRLGHIAGFCVRPEESSSSASALAFFVTDPLVLLTDGLTTLAREEGFRGMSKGMTLALIGVSNGAIQFMTYEEIKKRRVELRRKRLGAGASDEEIKRLVSFMRGRPACLCGGRCRRN